MIAKDIREQGTGTSRMIQSIPVSCIRPNPYQPRRSFSEASINELARSIIRYGLIQPIAVRQIAHGQYELIAGERRLRATRKAGFATINAIVYSAGEQESAVLALIENLQRENLHFFDEAEAYKNLLMEHGLTQEELAQRIGKNQSTIANKLRILRLSQRVKDAICACRLTERHARTLLRIPDEEVQMRLIEQIRREGLSVKETEDLVEKILDKMSAAEEPCRKVITVFRDGRLLINGIKKMVEQVSSSGLKASYHLADTEESYEIHVSIPKITKKQIKQ